MANKTCVSELRAARAAINEQIAALTPQARMRPSLREVVQTEMENMGYDPQAVADALDLCDETADRSWSQAEVEYWVQRMLDNGA